MEKGWQGKSRRMTPVQSDEMTRGRKGKAETTLAPHIGLASPKRRPMMNTSKRSPQQSSQLPRCWAPLLALTALAVKRPRPDQEGELAI